MSEKETTAGRQLADCGSGDAWILEYAGNHEDILSCRENAEDQENTERYAAMFREVEALLAEYDKTGGKGRHKIRYSRIDHTKRVYCWMEKLYEAYPEKDSLDADALRIATIFHDCGYCAMADGAAEKLLPGEKHAAVSARLCRGYLEREGFPEETIDFICRLIAQHSDKSLLTKDIPAELLLLLEADLLDDTGLQGIVVDIWMEVAAKEDATFESIIKHIRRFTLGMMRENPMRTAKAREIWKEKRRLTEQFVKKLEEDLEMPEEFNRVLP